MSQLNITDEILSAFLDAELTETEMQQVREQLLIDDGLAERLADLAMVDEIIANQYQEINHQPIPSAVSELLAEDKQQAVESKQTNIVQLSKWQKMHKSVQQHVAMAASVALVAGFSVASLLSTNASFDNEQQWAQITNMLEQKASGESDILANGDMFKPKLSFKNQAGQFCRHYEMTSEIQASQNIACRMAGEWQLTASFFQAKQDENQYQTATSNSQVRNYIEQSAVGDFLDSQAERAAIAAQWSK
ncbi:hypothetical protein [Catenovulum maritimum]|uniref:Anti sigma-E protein RseA N-terminal domain-containing protein n=1 Tax=Catenovulum maritimum TaxID=1513271 RepID=A0A0J8GSY4_9ALTE|nr:hypothetical protein [Catenovulum maritimum]KMT65905.1 hypothetical protein XM47_05410 [Catenovulum maritimum]